MPLVNTVEDADLLAKFLCDPTMTAHEALRMYRADQKRRARRKVPLPVDETEPTEVPKPRPAERG